MSNHKHYLIIYPIYIWFLG